MTAGEISAMLHRSSPHFEDAHALLDEESHHRASEALSQLREPTPDCFHNNSQKGGSSEPSKQIQEEQYTIMSKVMDVMKEVELKSG
jgi:hypothetical protein